MKQFLEDFLNQTPEWLTSYTAMAFIGFGVFAVFVGNLNSVLDFFARFRDKPVTNAEIEQYRGNLIGKFRALDKEVYSEIKRMKAEPKYPMIDGAPPKDTQIEFLQNFRAEVDLIRKQTFLALDRGNIVEAHETLNDLRKLAIESKVDLEEHQKALEASMVMCISSCGLHGSYVELFSLKVKILAKILKHINKRDLI